MAAKIKDGVMQFCEKYTDYILEVKAIVQTSRWENIRGVSSGRITYENQLHGLTVEGLIRLTSHRIFSPCTGTYRCVDRIVDGIFR